MIKQKNDNQIVLFSYFPDTNKILYLIFIQKSFYQIEKQRDKQIIFVCRADIQLFNLSAGY